MYEECFPFVPDRARNSRTLIYLATPYKLRWNLPSKYNPGQEAAFLTASLLQLGLQVFSPIQYCHEIHRLIPTYDWLYQIDHTMLLKSEYLLIAKFPGWAQSAGIRVERRWAKEKGIPEGFITWANCKKLVKGIIGVEL